MKLKGTTLDELTNEFKIIGEPAYRAKQAFLRINRHRARSLDEFTEFSLSLRGRLKEDKSFPHLKLKHRSLSAGGTEKFMFESPEKVPSGTGNVRFRSFEAVWIVSEDRRTACISSQSGCSLNCTFCATGTLPFIGNLRAWEIVDQVYDMIHYRQEPVTNVVFMGMGEPFYNYEEVMKAADILHDAEGLNLGAKHITISTAGVVPKIHRFIDENRPYNLAISLNHPDHSQRSSVMDIDERYPLVDLLDAAKRYTVETGRTVTFEYVLIPEVNMSGENLKQLISIARGMKCKINLIPLNTAFNGWKRPSEEQVSSFQAALRQAGILAFNRGSPGLDVDGACGMLALRTQNE